MSYLVAVVDSVACGEQCTRTLEGLVSQRQALKEFAESEAQAMKQTSEEMIQVFTVAINITKHF